MTANNGSFLRPSSSGLRRPTDANQQNGQVMNPPRYSEFGGLSGPSKVTDKDGMPFSISKPNGGRGV